jgi:hypothetical protein
VVSGRRSGKKALGTPNSPAKPDIFNFTKCIILELWIFIVDLMISAIVNRNGLSKTANLIDGITNTLEQQVWWSKSGWRPVENFLGFF